MKTKLTTLALLISIVAISQNSINYKAIIKDTNGNVIANDLIQIQFSILQGVAQTNVYQETHTPTTDANGLIIVNIGEGTTSNVFTDIDWSLDDHFLNVQIDTGGGLVDLGTTQFMHVPYAIQAEQATIAQNVNGLEAIDEGNGIGWRLVGRDSNLHNNLGENAVDLSYSSGSLGNRGAFGQSSVALGYDNNANEFASTAIGYGSTADGNSSAVIGSYNYAGGYSSIALGYRSNASGSRAIAMGNETLALGNNSTSMGLLTRAEAQTSLAIGRYNVGGGSATQWSDFDPLFEIGNGTSSSNRSNALTVRKNGNHIISSSSTGLNINAEGTGIYVSNPGYNGMTILNPENNGIDISNSNDNGIEISYSNGNGIDIDNSGINGILVSGAEEYGARITGTTAGIRASASNWDNPDIILAGNNSLGGNTDDGLLSSDPNYSSSDLYLRSYDGVIVELDYDDNESGFFRVRNGDGVNAFSVSEGGNATLAGSLTQNSDKRLKQDIVDLSYGLNEILELQPKQYYWKNKEQNKKSLGLIAQDVQPIMNEIVNIQDNETKTLGISYIELIPVLIKAIQEQQKIINTQKTELNNLSAELENIKDLDSRVKQLEMLLKTVER